MKKESKSGSQFNNDAEADKGGKGKKGKIQKKETENHTGKTKEQHEWERKKFRGKRNSPGARMAGFKGGMQSGKKQKFVPKNAQNKGGIVGAKAGRIATQKREQLEA